MYAYRPRTETLHWAGALTLGFGVVALVTRDATYLVLATLGFAVALQCTQRIVVDGRYVQRSGLRAATVDLATAKVVHAGSSWWRELFLAGPVFQLRDAEGNRLYVESWLWSVHVRGALLRAVEGRVHP
jgi:hypothetical protein